MGLRIALAEVSRMTADARHKPNIRWLHSAAAAVDILEMELQIPHEEPCDD